MNKKVYDNLSKGEVFVVKWQYGIGGGFNKALAEAICKADEYNKMKLCLRFPDEVEAMDKYFYGDCWWSELEKRLKSDPEELRRY